MSCQNSVTTKTGTFTFYEEVVSRCEAELRCMKKGELLAPITNTQDANKIVKLFNNNVGKEHCTFATNVAYSYWIGLNITYNESKQEKIFSNGIQWNDTKHMKIYTNYLKEYSDCPIAMFQPYFPPKPFPIMGDSESCKVGSWVRYVCLKPNDDKSAESIIQDKDSLKSVVTLPTGLVFAVAASALLVVVVGVIAIARMHTKIKRLSKNNNELRLGHEQARMTENINTNIGITKEEI